MKAAVLTKIPGDYEIVDIDIDEPGPQEVLIRTAAAGLCHSDVQFIEGRQTMQTPFVPGHESSGVVEAVGSAVTYVRPGDHVVTYLNSFCGSCKYCLSGRPFACRETSTSRQMDQPSRLKWNGNGIDQFFDVSSFAEQLLVHESQVAKVPTELPLDKAALLGCATITGFGSVIHTAQVRPGDDVVVFGCGGIGLNIIQGARIAGARQIIAVDPHPSRTDLALLMGATASVEAGESAVDEIIHLTNGGADYAFDAIGLKSVAEQAVACVSRGSAAVIVGMMPETDRLEVSALDMVIGKRILGSSMGSNRARLDIPFYADLYLQGRLNLDDLVSHHLTLDQINVAVSGMQSAEGLRHVITF
jgi:S-(hydroxymethyl)glutathione dehydrogenase/alcohol dehydrogenase